MQCICNVRLDCVYLIMRPLCMSMLASSCRSYEQQSVSHKRQQQTTNVLSTSVQLQISPPHFKWHPLLMHTGPIAPPIPRLRPRAARFSTAREMYQHIFDCGGPWACRTHQPFPLCRQWPPLQMLRVLPCFGVAIFPNPTWTAYMAAQPLPTPSLIPPVAGAMLT
jgi:hypothetical protein